MFLAGALPIKTKSASSPRTTAKQAMTKYVKKLNISLGDVFRENGKIKCDSELNNE